jgi:hypothetical protein
MKAIILISSIFYILGLKVSHQIEVVKKSDLTEKISVVEKAVKPIPLNSITMNEGLSIVNPTDSAQKSGITGDHFLRSK